MLVQLLKVIYEKVNQEIYYRKENAISVNEFFDNLSLYDKEMLLNFITNGNKILISNELYIPSDSGFLGNREVINSSYFSGDLTCINNKKYWLDPILENALSKEMHIPKFLYQYKFNGITFKQLNWFIDNKEN